MLNTNVHLTYCLCTDVDDAPNDAVVLPFAVGIYKGNASAVYISPNGYITAVVEGFCGYVECLLVVPASWHARLRGSGFFMHQGCTFLSSYRGIVAPYVADLNPAQVWAVSLFRFRT